MNCIIFSSTPSNQSTFLVCLSGASKHYIHCMHCTDCVPQLATYVPWQLPYFLNSIIDHQLHLISWSFYCITCLFFFRCDDWYCSHLAVGLLFLFSTSATLLASLFKLMSFCYCVLIKVLDFLPTNCSSNC